ncbi:MAG: Trimethylamine-N-oxide reductase (cytochrome c) [Clostridiales bacterium]|nr:Trimethylamine-N-oxide reductase (cytochrome c) [Clostridiales bacterium]
MVFNLSFKKEGYTVTRHVCPRNCYDACGMLAFTRNGILKKIDGDPKHGYTRGKLCAKGYSYVQRVYDPNRLKYPILQKKRGSGQWKRITWDEALDIIANKILELKSRYGSHLSMALNKYSGNFGILHYAVEGFFNSLGPTTLAVGSPCWSAGLDAHFYDFGAHKTSDPENIKNAQLIILWGINPAWTAVHSMPFINEAKKCGAKIIVIDPVFTTTAKKSDIYIQVNPGSDGALALAIAKILLEKGLYDKNFIDKYTYGWEKFKRYLEGYDVEEAASLCGQKPGLIKDLAEMLGSTKPAFIWTGFGLQRYVNGGQNLRAINALGAITGNIGLPGGGVHFAHQDTWDFNLNFLNVGQDKNEKGKSTRYVNINNFASQLKNIEDPPVKMLWISCRNPITQDADSSKLLDALKDLELIVTVEHYLTPTAQYSDIVLPATTHFEELDVVPSYWHHWIGINEQAIKPYFESKSDLEIAQLISKKLNELSPGSCNFPYKIKAENILDGLFNEKIYRMLDIKHWSELRESPQRADIPFTAWKDRKFKTDSGKYEFYSHNAKTNQLPALPVLKKGTNCDLKYPYRLLTPHSQHGLNSQFQNLRCILKVNPEPVILINPKTAHKKNITENATIKIFNNYGEVIAKAKISRDIPSDIILCYQGWFPNINFNLNKLTPGLSTDMGEIVTGSKGIAFYNVFVDIEKI